MEMCVDHNRVLFQDGEVHNKGPRSFEPSTQLQRRELQRACCLMAPRFEAFYIVTVWRACEHCK